MLRQVFLFESSNIIFKHFFARGYTDEDLDIVLKKISSHIDAPIQGKLFNRPLLDFQIIYGKIGKLFYLFVADKVDRASYIEKEISKLSKKIDGLGSILEVSQNKDGKENIINFLRELNIELHPKIAFVGSVGAGRTSLIERIKDSDSSSRDIMTFAKVSQSTIADIVFDLWDFQPADYSPLWNNFVKGSDLNILVFNATEISDNKIIQFINLCKREGKFSKVLILLSHAADDGAISIDQYQDKYGELLDVPIYSYDLFDENAPNLIFEAIIEVLDLKQQLPANFRSLLIDSNTAISEKNYPKAIAGLKELLAIAIEYQELSYSEIFKSKIKELEVLWEDTKKSVELEKLKIKAPEKKVFAEKISIKSLPSLPKPNIPLNKSIDKNITKPKVVDFTKNLEPKEQKIKSTLKIIEEEKEPELPKTDSSGKKLIFARSPLVKEEIVRKPIQKVEEINQPKSLADIEIKTAFSRDKTLENDLKRKAELESKYTNIENIEKDAKKNQLHGIFTANPIVALEIDNKQKEKAQLNHETELLFTTIKEMGKSLRIESCKKFVEQIRNRMKKDKLNDSEVINAAKLFVQKLKNKED